MAETIPSQTRIQVKNVRLSFPSVFERSVFKGKEGKYKATLLIPKEDTKTLNRIKSLMKAVVAERRVKVPSDKYCLSNGDDYEYDGYEDHMALTASSNRRPTVVGRDLTPLTDDDEVIYAGCYVNALVGFWVQNNEFGKRVNANLFGIQFVRDGDAFGAGPVDVTKEFDKMDSDEDEDDMFDDDEEEEEEEEEVAPKKKVRKTKKVRR